jgi:PAS domain S-box-containing protein
MVKRRTAGNLPTSTKPDVEVILTDITERQKAEEALRESQKFSSSLLENSPNPILVTNPDTSVRYVNPAFEKLTGFTLAEITGRKAPYPWWPKEQRDEITTTFKDAIVTGGRRTERIFQKKNGERFWVALNSAPIMDRGKLIYFLINWLDITEHKKADEALQAEKNKLQSVIDAMEDGLTIQDKDYNIIYQNELVKTIFGYRLGEKCYRVYEGRDKICDGCPVEKAFRDGKSHTSERRVVMPSGEVTFWENTANPIRDAEGRIVSCLEINRNITERKKAEQALADEATWRRILVEQSRDGIVILDQNGKVFEANQQFAEMLGYTPEEVAQLDVWDWEYLYPRERVLEMIRTVDEAGDHFETRHRRKDGSVYDVEISTNGAIFAGQKLIFCVCRDITERKQAEGALREAEEKYKNLIEATSDMIWEADETGTFTFVSPRIKDFLGYEVNEVVGKIRTLDLVPKEEARKWLNRFKEINTKKAPFFGFEITHLHKNGNQVVFEISGIPLFDSAGNFKGFVGINKDITERKKAEERVRSAAEEWRTTFDSITDFISIHDRNNRIVRMNKAFADALKTTPKELIGKFCHELTHGTKEPPANCPQRQTLKTGKPATIEVYDSNLGIYVQESTSPIFDEKGKVAGSVHIAKNITERKQMEEQLMLTDRLASIGELASGIAHELNNPLTSVIGFSQLLLEEDIPENLKEDLVTIYSEAQRASSIVKNLLTFARKHAPMRQLSQVNSIIDDVLRLRAYEHKVNNIKVEKRFAPNLPEIMVDYFQMQQVFLNIIVNAESSMLQANGKGKLVITTARVNNVIKATIADDGPGIAKENLRRVFDPFFTTKEVGKGTGLGLSICHGIVTEHGGRIYAESEISKGAAFAVELPIDGRPRRKEEQV